MRLRVRGGLVLVLAIAAGCAPKGDRERQGDTAYTEGRYEAAFSDYAIALRQDTTARLLAKLAGAALHTGALDTAAAAYRRLAVADPSRMAEAANGLEEVAHAAERAGNRESLSAAVVGLRALAPSRAMGRYAVLLASSAAEAGDSTALAILPQAIAAAPDAETADSLLLAYGQALEATGNCESAAMVFAAVRRRERGALGDAAGPDLLRCSMQLGDRAMGDSDFVRAERWFGQAVAIDSTAVSGRRALLLVARARVGEGDTIGAALALQTALRLDTAIDSISQAATRELHRILGVPGDTVPSEVP